MEENAKLEDIIGAWPVTQPGTREAFEELAFYALAIPGTTIDVVRRPGVSYSVRAMAERPVSPRPLYFLVDVIVSDADPWFLSACFYEDEVTDPENIGNTVPQGLFEEDGYCFDVDGYDPEKLQYLEERINEAYNCAIGTACDTTPLL